MDLKQLMRLKTPRGTVYHATNLLDVLQWSLLYNIYYYNVYKGRVLDPAVDGGNSDFIWFSQTFSAGTYTLSCKTTGTGVKGARILCSENFEGGIYVEAYGGYYADLTDGEISITVEDTFSIGVCFLTGTEGQTGEIYDIMFEEGDTAHAYVAYKNGFNELSYTFIDDVIIYEDGKEEECEEVSATTYTEIPNNTQTFRIGAIDQSYEKYSAFYDSDHTFISSFEYSSGMNNVTVPANAKYVRVSSPTADKGYLRIQAK